VIFIPESVYAYQLEELDVDGRILQWGWEGTGWSHVVEDRDQWQALVSTVMNLLDSIKGGEFLD
jgi:hypothetical protein